MGTRLDQLRANRFNRHEADRAAVRASLRTALQEAGALPARVFGSITQAGRFRDGSDVDVALTQLPAGWSLYGLTAWLAERLGRPTDIILLPECRFRETIERDAETWTR